MFTNWMTNGTNGSSGSEAKPNPNIHKNQSFCFILKNNPLFNPPKLETNKEHAVRVFQDMLKAIYKANRILEVHHKVDENYNILILTGAEEFIMMMELSETLCKCLQKQRQIGTCVPTGASKFMRDTQKAELINACGAQQIITLPPTNTLIN